MHMGAGLALRLWRFGDDVAACARGLRGRPISRPELEASAENGA
jgi:hypothetical protein